MLRVTEIFHSIQGESTHAGRPCVFIRLTGCNLRCVWCDTAYAFHGGSAMSVDDVLERVAGHGCRLVELTGGEPLLQPEAIGLMAALVERGYEVLIETGGSLPIEPVPAGVKRIVDVKCPGSGEVARNRWENLDALRPGDELKFVLADRADYDWAVGEIGRRGLAGRYPVLFSPVHGCLAPEELAGWVLRDRLAVRVQLQLHKLLWPEALRGV
ncbi:MAG TPA: radical SAM protein [Candidatus Polarisedimenticolaceae bacterium]|nr:radical SAM protein [Candidatus Polarisedimenticolaceae bacterium]